MLRASIVGLPNIGKTTLFNAVTAQTSAVTANYAFSTSKPNVGVVTVPDERLAPLAEIVKTKVIVPASVEFVDIDQTHELRPVRKEGARRAGQNGVGLERRILEAVA